MCDVIQNYTHFGFQRCTHFGVMPTCVGMTSMRVRVAKQIVPPKPATPLKNGCLRASFAGVEPGIGQDGHCALPLPGHERIPRDPRHLVRSLPPFSAHGCAVIPARSPSFWGNRDLASRNKQEKSLLSPHCGSPGRTVCIFSIPKSRILPTGRSYLAL